MITKMMKMTIKTANTEITVGELLLAGLLGLSLVGVPLLVKMLLIAVHFGGI